MARLVQVYYTYEVHVYVVLLRTWIRSPAMKALRYKRFSLSLFSFSFFFSVAFPIAARIREVTGRRHGVSLSRSAY